MKIIIIRDMIFKKIIAKIVKENILILKIKKILKFDLENSLKTLLLLLENIYFIKEVII